VAERIPLVRAVIDGDAMTTRTLATEHLARFEAAVRRLI